jgi:hypothetical protein
LSKTGYLNNNSFFGMCDNLGSMTKLFPSCKMGKIASSYWEGDKNPSFFLE